MAFYANQILHEDMKRLLSEQQSTTASYIAYEVTQELEARFKILTKVAEKVTPAMLAKPSVLQDFLENLLILQEPFNAGVIAMSAAGQVIADSVANTNQQKSTDINPAINEGLSTISRPQINKFTKNPEFNMTVPIRDSHDNIIGALSGITNLAKANFLEKATQRHYNKTGYFLIEDPKNRTIITGTDKNRIMQALPALGINPLIDRHVQGSDETGITVNPTGVRVLASAKRVPIADWFIVAALPTEEAFAPIHALKQRMLLATGIVTLLAGILTWLVLKHLLAPIISAAKSLSAYSNTDLPPPHLSVTRQDEIGNLINGFNHLLETLNQRNEALKDSEFRWKFAIKGAGDGLWDWNMRDNTVFFSKTWKAMLGYAEDEIGNGLDEWAKRVHPDDKTDTLTTVQAHIEGKTPYYLSEHRVLCKDGSYKWILDRGVIVSCSDVGEPLRMIGTHSDITQRKQAEADLRIAATAFECQEGIAIMNENLKILRVNRAFSHITGYSQQEVQGQAMTIFRSDRHCPTFYASIHSQIKQTGTWQGEVWQRRKNGEDYPVQLSISTVKDESGQVTNFVSNIIDNTNAHQQEQHRLQQEAAHRNILVREVHHRIKNNLQGITGILRQFAQTHPETSDPITQAISQVQSISIIHGLQGQAVAASVRACELTASIAAGIEALWQQAISIDIPDDWTPCIITESETVPLALILNELISNAVKHGGANGQVKVTLRLELNPCSIRLTIKNNGLIPTGFGCKNTTGFCTGLQLASSLLPQTGARLSWQQHEHTVLTLLELDPPIIQLEQLTTFNTHEH